ncbi:MAG: DUF4340 domain-containing protein [Cellulosilyticaceae bacterium]
MNQKKQLIGLSIVLVVLVGRYGVLQATNAPKDQEEIAVQQVDQVIGFEEKAMKSIDIASGENQVTLMPVEEKTEATEEEESVTYYTWKVEGGEGLVLRQDTINTMGERILGISASRTIENGDLESFGLNAPMMTLTYTTKEDQVETLVIGNKTPDEGSYYVMREADPDKVYLVDSYTFQDASPYFEDYREKTVGTIPKDTLTALTISGDGMETYQMKLEGEAILLAPNAEPLLMDGNKYSEVISALPMLTVDGFIEDHAVDTSQYGLDTPSFTIEVSYTELDTNENPTHQTKTYKWGDPYKEGTRYFMIEGETAVYTMKDAFIEELVAKLDVFELSEKYVCIPSINEVSEVAVEIGGKSYQLAIQREEIQVEKAKVEEGTNAAETETQMKCTYFINGKEVDEERFKDVYAALIGIKSDTELKDESIEETENEVVAFRYTLLNEKVKEAVFYPYDNQFYKTHLGGNKIVGANTRQFKGLQEKLEEVAP